jgi:hypothetical protein
MASAKYQTLARAYLLGEIDALADWLEANVNKIREEQPNAVVTLTRNSNFDAGPNMWSYANLGFEINCGDEAL